MYKKIVFFILLVITLQGFSSCTILQWRNSDEKINMQFLKANIPSEISYFNIDSLTLKIRTQTVKSDTSKLNIVFLHGSPSSLSAWNAYLLNDSLRQHANLIAVDRPGYGYSNFGNEMTSLETQIEVMSALVDHYKLKNVIVVGSSYGGPLAAGVAAANKNIKGVMMISPAIDPNQEKHVKGVKWTQFWLTAWMVPTGYRVAGDEKTVHAAELAKIEPLWKDIALPIVHIHGDKDELVPYTNVNYTKKMFSNSFITVSYTHLTLPTTPYV